MKKTILLTRRISKKLTLGDQSQQQQLGPRYAANVSGETKWQVLSPCHSCFCPPPITEKVSAPSLSENGETKNGCPPIVLKMGGQKCFAPAGTIKNFDQKWGGSTSKS